MECIILKADGAIREKNVPVAEPSLALLPMAIELDDGYCLKSFFKMLRTYPVYMEISMFNPVYLEQVGPFIDLDTTLPCHDPDTIEFSKTIEMKGFPGEPAIDIYTGLNGRKGQNLIALKNFHVETLLGVPMRLGKLKHIIFGDTQEILEFKTDYTLFEFIDGVSWGLSFLFNPIECQLRR
ncbi:MAG: hypothetical protein KJ737_22075 [Proteobacteria bacterium]|nr:hypothetical protein [Pseudomonadota bacterium]